MKNQKKTPYYNYKKLIFTQKIWFFLGVELGEQASIRSFFCFFISRLVLKSSLHRLNHQSSWAMINFFILCLISSHLRVYEIFLFYACSQLISKWKKFSLEKNNNFFRMGYFVFWAWYWKVRQVGPYSTTWICFWFWLCQNSEYARVLNISELHKVLSMPE